jgi:hypothetical protein
MRAEVSSRELIDTSHHCVRHSDDAQSMNNKLEFHYHPTLVGFGMAPKD